MDHVLAITTPWKDMHEGIESCQVSKSNGFLELSKVSSIEGNVTERDTGFCNPGILVTQFELKVRWAISSQL